MKSKRFLGPTQWSSQYVVCHALLKFTMKGVTISMRQRITNHDQISIF